MKKLTKIKSNIAKSVTLSLALGAMIGSAVITTASAEDTLSRLKEQGFARIAIANEPPWTAVNSDGTVTGAAPEVARAVLKKLGVPELLANVSEYGAMIPGLQASRFDMVTAGLFIKPERCEAVIFSQPDLCDGEAFAVKKGNPLHITNYAELAAHPTATVGAPGGGAEERLALEAGVPRARVIVIPDAQSGINMLQDGRIDVYALPFLSISDLLTKANDPGLEMVAPIANTPIYCAGAAFNKKDVALRDAYDVVLAEMKSNGEFDKIVTPFGFNAELAKLQTSENLCAGVQ